MEAEIREGTIKFTESCELIEIHDEKGNYIDEWEETDEIDISLLPLGVYIVSVISYFAEKKDFKVILEA